MARPDPRFLRGLELFNEGEYYECHEVIEELWLETPASDPYRDLYKGVIQAAAAVYQYKRGILSGAKGLYDSSIVYLGKYAPNAMGLEVSALIEAMRSYCAPLAVWDGRTALKAPRDGGPKLEYDKNGL